jgi:hypothetical protein
MVALYASTIDCAHASFCALSSPGASSTRPTTSERRLRLALEGSTAEEEEEKEEEEEEEEEGSAVSGVAKGCHSEAIGSGRGDDD